MKKFRIFLQMAVIVVLILGVLKVNPVTTYAFYDNDQPISIKNIEVTPNTSGDVADYKIEMTNNTENTFYNGISIIVKFPESVHLPSNISQSDILVENTPLDNSPTVDLDMHKVLFASPVDITAGNFTIEFKSDAGIRNPEVDTEQTCQLDVIIGSTNNASGTFEIVPSSSQDVTVNVYPNVAGKTADYTILFANKFILQNGDYIDVKFPQETLLPNTIPNGLITLNGHSVYGIQMPDKAIIRLPVADLVRAGQVSIDIPSSVDIRNPKMPGKYYIQVESNRMSNWATSNYYQIVGTFAGDLKVSITPNFQGANSEIDLSFVTSSSGAIQIGGGIYIEFPDKMIMPQDPNPDYIVMKVGASTSSVKDALIKDNNVLYLEAPFLVSGNTKVEIDIAKEFGIRNPDTKGQYTLRLYTDSDATPVSADFSIANSIISGVTVNLSNYSSGSNAEYKILFNTGLGGAMESGSDKIYIVFPVGTFIPDFVKGGAVTVNGVSTNCSVDLPNRRLSVLVPGNVNANETVIVDIPAEVGIKNPITPGPYTISVSTSREPSYVSSTPYNIVNTPVSYIKVIPQKPDGKNGYYITQPVVTLSASSPIDQNPQIYYYFNDNKPTLYAGPIKVPEGSSILSYYAVDHQGNKGNVKSITFKFDDILPTLEIISPKNNEILNNRHITVGGSTEPDATLFINGKQVNISKGGNFSYSFDIMGTSGVITVKCIDLAGNVVTKTINVSIDVTPPPLTIVSPISFQKITSLPLEVKGKTEKDAEVTVNGQKAAVDDNGMFSYKINSLEKSGLVVINVVAKDAAGNTTHKSVTVEYVKRISITLQVGNKVALINNRTVSLDASPIIDKHSSRTLVPLRFISESFGAKIVWDGVFKVIDIELNNVHIRLQVGKSFASVNGKKVTLDAPPIIYMNRTMVPLRFISEMLDAQVQWIQSTKTIIIYYPKGG